MLDSYLVPTTPLVADHVIHGFAPAACDDNVVVTAGSVYATAELAVGIAQAGCHARRVNAVSCRGGGGILGESAAHGGQDDMAVRLRRCIVLRTREN
jgi:hypothetical protein